MLYAPQFEDRLLTRNDLEGRRSGTIFQQGVKVKNHMFDISEVSFFDPISNFRGSVDPVTPDFRHLCSRATKTDMDSNC